MVYQLLLRVVSVLTTWKANPGAAYAALSTDTWSSSCCWAC